MGSREPGYWSLPCMDLWFYDPRLAQLQHTHSGLCLKVTRSVPALTNRNTVKYRGSLYRSPLKLWLVPCNNADTEQKFYFTNYNEDGIPPILEEDMEEELEEREQRHTEL